MKKIVQRLAVITMAVAVTFTSLPPMTGGFSYAATAKKPAKVTGVKKVTATTTSIKIKWNRIPKNKNTKGYVVYRNGKIIKSGKKIVRMGKNTLNYTDKKLKANTTYKYRVRAYNTYKQKQYYNSKKKKWQNSKPKKKHWKGKKTRKVTKYRYGAYSAEVKIKTSAVKPAVRPAANTEKSSQTITVPGDVTSKTLAVGDAFDIGAYASSKLTVSYASSNANVATVSSGGYVTANSEGTATITISQAGNSSYKAASNKTVTIEVVDNRIEQNIFIPGDASSMTLDVGDTWDIGAYTDSGLSVSYISGKASVASVVSSGRVSAKGGGTAIITVKQAGNSTYKPVEKKITINVNETRESQVINIPVSSLTLKVDEMYSIGATTSSGLAVTYASNNTSVAAVSSSGQVTAKAVGSATITVKQAGNGEYAPASSKTVSVKVEKKSTSTARLTESPNRYTMYNGVKVYCGQDFTTSLLNQLKAASDGGYKKVTRPASNEFPAGNVVNMDIHFFGINTYNPFLAVYVISNQVYSICANSEEMFILDGNIIRRGGAYKTMANFAATPTSNGSSSGMLLSRIYTTTVVSNTDKWSPDVEREVAFHFTNAARVAGGSTILKRSYYLEGAGPSGKSWAPGVIRLSSGDLVYSGTTSNGKTYTNQRFGAQAWAESMYEYGNITHSVMNVGPHAGISQSTIISCIYKEITGKSLGVIGDNVGMSGAGDSMVFGTGTSGGHWSLLMNPEMKSVGAGVYKGKAAMFFAEVELD